MGGIDIFDGGEDVSSKVLRSWRRSSDNGETGLAFLGRRHDCVGEGNRWASVDVV